MSIHPVLGELAEPLEFTTQEFVYLCTAFIVGLVISWIAVFVCLRNQPKTLLALFADGLIIRILTVVFIVCCAFGLALVGRLSAEVSTILAGISGYVLGGAHAQNKRSDTDQEGN